MQFDLTDSQAFSLPYQPPLDWQTLLGFLQYRAIDGLEWVNTEHLQYARSLVINGSRGWVYLIAKPERATATVHISTSLLAAKNHIIALCQGVFDLPANPAEIDTKLSQHPLLAQYIPRHPGLRVPGCWDRFELAVRAIAGQLVSVKSATTISKKIVVQYGEPTSPNPFGFTHTFPTPARLAAQAMHDVGLTKTRSHAVQHLAQQIDNGALDLASQLTETEILTRLTALPGIGAWTAEYIAMRAFKLPDAFPAGDLILRRAIMPGKQLTEAQCRKATETLAPWRAYAALHLWTHYSEHQT